jgi:hypothetical protein
MSIKSDILIRLYQENVTAVNAPLTGTRVLSGDNPFAVLDILRLDMKQHIYALVGFAMLAIVMTYPLAIEMGEAVQEPGDSLFVTWTIAWDIKAMLNNPLNIFNANIYYPYKYTLAYSEHMIGVGLLALPFYLLTQNPIFTYNAMLLLSFVLSSWGTYLLVCNLTRDKLAGIIGGIIFGFCPYRFDQLGHLHVLTSQWVPFTMLFLHKFAEIKTWKYLIGFGLFFFLQLISSGHNGLYLAFAIVLFLLYFRKNTGIYPWIVVFIVALLLIPFYYPYVHLSKSFGFERALEDFKLYSPQLDSYLGVTGENWLYGRILNRFSRAEAVMFPGIVALLLIFWGKYTPSFRPKVKKYTYPRTNVVLNAFIIIDLLLIVFIGITGGIDLGISVAGIKLKVTDFTRPIGLLCILYFFKLMLNWRNVQTGIISSARKIFFNTGPVKFYCILGISAFLLSFGPYIRLMDKDIIWGPYNLLYNFFPGFKGLRVSGRIYTIFILAVAVLAGFGLQRMKKSTRLLSRLAIVMPFLVIIEYLNVPLSMQCRIGTKPPSVYEWLAKQDDDSVIIELPMPEWYNMLPQEIQYMYWSIYHNKKMVNGYSGYSPPAYWPVAEKMKWFPNEDTIEMLKILGVKYVVIHYADIRSWGFPDVMEKIDQYKDVFTMKFHNGWDYVYELMDRAQEPVNETKCEFIPKNNWGVKTNYNLKNICYAIDNDLTTRWQSGAPQKKDMWVELDMGKIEKIAGVAMCFEKALNDYPRGLALEVSKDGKNWDSVRLEHIYANYVKHLLEYPKDRNMIIKFPAVSARFVKIIQTEDNDVFFWSIYELDVLKNDK